MKTIAVITSTIFFLLSASFAQNARGPAAQQAPPPPGSITAGNPGNLTATNAAGTNVTLEELAAQLSTLRADVQATLPALTAFNQQAASQNQSLTGTLGNILSRNRNPQQSSSTSTSQEITNVLGALGSLVNTNAANASPANKSTLQDLAALQRDLEPVEQLLQRLAPNTATNQLNTPNNGRVLTPTGR